MQTTVDSYQILGRHDFPVQTVRTNADGSWLLTGDTERQICLWRDGLLVRKINAKTPNMKAATMDRLRSIAFSNDSEQFLVASGHTLRSYRTVDGKVLWSYSLPRFLGFLMSAPVSVDASSDGRFAIACDNGTFGIRDGFGRKLRQWKHNAAPRWLRFAKGETHMIGSDSFSIRLWDCETGETVRGYSSDERVYSLESCHALPIFAARSLHAIQFYHLDSSEPFQVVPTSTGLPLLAFSPVGNLLASCSEHGISIFEISSSESGVSAVYELKVIPVPEVTVLSITFSAAGTSVFVGCSDCSIREYNW